MHPYFRQPDVLAANAEHGIVTQAWSPIGGITLEDPVINGIAQAHGRTPTGDAALATAARSVGQPKSVTPSRIAENLDVFGFELTDDELAVVDALDTGVPGGPPPEAVTRAAFGCDIPEA